MRSEIAINLAQILSMESKFIFINSKEVNLKENCAAGFSQGEPAAQFPLKPLLAKVCQTRTQRLRLVSCDSK